MKGAGGGEREGRGVGVVPPPPHITPARAACAVPARPSPSPSVQRHCEQRCAPQTPSSPLLSSQPPWPWVTFSPPNPPPPRVLVWVPLRLSYDPVDCGVLCLQMLSCSLPLIQGLLSHALPSFRPPPRLFLPYRMGTSNCIRPRTCPWRIDLYTCPVRTQEMNEGNKQKSAPIWVLVD
jgi:hypothetical protein